MSRARLKFFWRDPDLGCKNQDWFEKYRPWVPLGEKSNNHLVKFLEKLLFFIFLGTHMRVS